MVRRHPAQVEGQLIYGALPLQFPIDIGMQRVGPLDVLNLRPDHVDLASVELARVEIASVLHVNQPLRVDAHALSADAVGSDIIRRSNDQPRGYPGSRIGAVSSHPLTAIDHRSPHREYNEMLASFYQWRSS